MELDEDRRAYLRGLPAVERVSVTERGARIIYAPWFIDECIRRYKAGEGPVAIFRSHGLGPDIIGRKRIERCIARWRDRKGRPLTDILPVPTGTDDAAAGDAVTPGTAMIAATNMRLNAVEDRLDRLAAELDGLRHDTAMPTADTDTPTTTSTPYHGGGANREDHRKEGEES